jgi:AcrR family transcriptional regulator
MRARAEATARTRERILRAARDLSVERVSLDVVLADVAERAGVSVQTVLRHFKTREALFDAVVHLGRTEVVEERTAPSGDVPAAMRAIVSHYELRGDFVLNLLAQARRDPRVAEVVEPGKALHRRWVAEVFAPQLAERPARSRDVLTDLLVVATDVYAWALLRRDRQLSRATVERRMTQLVHAILRQESEHG